MQCFRSSNKGSRSNIYSEPVAVTGSTDEVTFTINGKTYKVDATLPQDTSLNTFIRDVANLKGTKYMCQEGGCGACIVSATIEHPISKQRETKAVNSCLVRVFSCHGWEVRTVEGIGDRQKGYHKTQAQLAKFNGTQCGFCSPGMVMNMYSLLEGGKAPTMADVENAFGGNICRCTGYRPILDAFKALASNATPQLKAACADIEDIYKICPKTNEQCSGTCRDVPKSVALRSDGVTWRTVTSIAELREALTNVGEVPYKLVAGNTAEGVYRSEGIMAYIDLNGVPELRAIDKKADKITLGANVNLTEAMQFFNSVTDKGFTYLKQLGTHIDWIANVPVRNVGTLAGNLSIKHSHHEFPSDIFTSFEAAGAKLNIMDASGDVKKVTLVDYLVLDMTKKFIHSIEFSPKGENTRFRTFKITPRAQNAHAYVNAGFCFEFENTSSWKVVGQPRIVIGGINPEFTHATNIETFLTGKSLTENSTIAAALAELGRQLLPDRVLPDASVEYRKNLAQALFYKFVLGLDSSKVSAAHKSGGDNLVRPLSSGKQDFDTDKSLYPLNEAVPKIEAIAQCSGEAEYVNDIPTIPGELHAAFVLTTISTGTISNIDATEALALPGVTTFLKHTDLEKYNTFTPKDFGYVEEEEILCSGTIKYAGQAVGLVVAETRDIALKAADLVKVEYKTSATLKPVLDIAEVLHHAGNRIHAEKTDAPAATTNGEAEVQAAKVVKGEFEIPKQYHLTMENQSCLVVPKEDDSFDVFSTTQWIDLGQAVVARCLGIKASKVNMSVRRLGGGYGAKITRPSQLAGACAVASQKLNKAIRMVMPLTANMELAGKRFGIRNEYEVGVDTNGKIEYLKAKFFQDSGCNLNDSPLRSTIQHFNNCYNASKFQVESQQIRTDTASNTWCRAPGTTEGVALIEEIMEHIATDLKKDPLEVRLANMHTDDNPIPQMVEDLKKIADYDNRKAAVKQFNEANRWKKRGLALVPMQYPFDFWGNHPAIVSVYQIDGSVAISHGGIEMGQGMNTKVAQVAAHILGVPLDMISVKPSNNLSSANAIVTGGSLGSEAISYATMQCCKEILKRLEPVKEKMPTASWPELIKAAHHKQVDLVATYMFTTKDDVKAYNIWGVTIAEVEVDILTGEKQVLRIDLLEDAGQSLSPMVDVGQMEGAFVMGMGYWLTEELIHEPQTGRLLNTRTWNYKVPGAKDIPADFRVHFRKNSKNPTGVLQSKATGEPPLNMSIVVLFAVTAALNSARQDSGAPQGYHQLKPPATAEHIFLSGLADPKDFKL
ncbi:uncharacterized protein LOC132202920 isoform X2 [Neocloeon triangulifer]|uniref:uncharacterized protein LOC132202920 isoform X2 n=1 Tax=Neocloeon triangulifer TaxID=2078957 RepID=UPI00286F2053|nr:uncharacterized protein LOC132202920 isoform X2 [Neocloeon triangulifer]